MVEGYRVTSKLKSNIGKRLAAAGLASALGLTAPASATTIDITGVAVPYSQAVTLTGGLIPSDPTNIGIAGEIWLTTNLGTLYTWCVDLYHVIYLGNQQYTYVTGALQTDNSGSTPGQSNTLSATQIADIERLAAYGTSQLPFATYQNAFSAAIQSAIWEVEYNTVATSSDPQFGLYLSYINSILANLSPPANPGFQLYDQDGQSVFVAQGLYDANLPPSVGADIEPVPEPATLALLTLGLAGLGFSRRKQ